MSGNKSGMRFFIMKKLVTLTRSADFTILRKQFDGRSHLVVPVTILVEGVHVGMSAERIFYSSEVLSHIPQKWDDTATLEDHPLDENGNAVSANSVSVQESKVIGRLYNSHFDNNGLKCEIWIDENKAKAVSPDFMQALED